MADQSPPKRRAPRRDAQRHREALILAAASSFRADGYNVPLEVIADRAGVGRGTLYRNFKDRAALALAIFSREVDQFEAALDPAAPIGETIGLMMRSGAPASMLFKQIAVDLHREDANLTAFQSLGQRLETVFEPAVAQAQARGELDRSITPHEVVLAVRMAGGLLLPFMDDTEIAALIDAALKLLIDGLRPR